MVIRRAHVLAVGALLAVTVALAALALGPGPRYELSAAFEQVHGLVAGAEVRAAGLRVGEVREISLGADGLPRVRMDVDSDYAMRRGATAEVRAFSVAGEVNRYVMLHQGEGPELPEGATLGTGRTDEPVEIDQVISMLDPATRADVRSVLSKLDRATAGRGPDIEAALAHSADALGETAKLLGEVRGDGAALRTLLRRGHRVGTALARDPGALGATADRMGELLATTARRQADLAAGLDRLTAGLRSPRLALERTRAAVPALRAFVRDARPAARKLVPLADDLRPALRAARPTLREARALVASAPADLRRLDALLRTAQPVLERLDPVLRSANPMLNQLRARLPDFFAFFANWADFTAGYDANGHGARIGLVFAPAPTGPVGSSDAAGGELDPPFSRTPGVLEAEPWTDFQQSFTGDGS